MDVHARLRETVYIIESRHVIRNNVAFLTSVDSDEPMQPPFKLRNS